MVAQSFPVDLVVRTNQAERGARQGERILNRLDRSATRTESTVASLGRRLVQLASAYAGFSAVRGAITTFANFQRSMSRVAALTGATTDQLNMLSEAARRVGATTELSATQGADAIAFLSQAGFTAEQSLASLDDIVNLSIGGQIDFATAADISSNVLTDFGLRAEEARRVTDVLGNTAASSNVSISQLGASLRFVAPAAAAVGVSIEEASAAIGELGNAGIQGTMAGSALRAIISRLVDGGFDLSNGLIPVLEQLADANTGLAEANELVGLEAGTALTVLINQRRELEGLTEANRAAEGTMEEMARTIGDNLLGDFRALRSAIEDVAIELGQNSETGLRSIVQSLTTAVRFLGQNIEIITGALTGLAAFLLATGAFRLLITSLGLVVGLIESTIFGILTLVSSLQLGASSLTGFAALLGTIAGFLATISAIAAGGIAFLTAFRETFLESDQSPVRELGAILEAMIRTMMDLIRIAIPNFESFAEDWDLLFAEFARVTRSFILLMADVVDILETTVGYVVGFLRAFRDEGFDPSGEFAAFRNRRAQGRDVFENQAQPLIEAITRSIEDLDRNERLRQQFPGITAAGLAELGTLPDDQLVRGLTNLIEQLRELDLTGAGFRNRLLANDAIVRGEQEIADRELVPRAQPRFRRSFPRSVVDVAGGETTDGQTDLQQERTDLEELIGQLTVRFNREQELLGLSERERDIRREVFTIQDQFARAGLVLSQRQIDMIRGVINTLQEQREAQAQLARAARAAGQIIGGAFNEVFTTITEGWEKLEMIL